MPLKSKSDSGASASSVVSMLTELARQGTESFFATQRILLDLVVRQNSHTINVIRERLKEGQSAPAQALTEIAGEAISSFIAAQRVILQLAERQNEIVMTGVRERTVAVAPIAAMTGVLRRGVETFIGMNQDLLTTAAKQTDLWIDALKDGKPFDGKGVRELAQEAMEKFIRAQKKFLDVVAEETVAAVEPGRNGKHARKTDLGDLARQGAEAFLDAQKKLLDIASQQVAVDIKVSRETLERMNPFSAIRFADITRNTVESLVTAQRALLDAIPKPARGASAASPEAHTHRPKRRQTGRAKHAPVPVPV